MRKIIHIDMDAFYPSVEQRDQPDLRGKPVIVGGDPRKRGVVASASYEARAFGVRSAMSAAHAYRLCPQAIFLRPHFEKYLVVSRQIRHILESITFLVEPLSLDEAYLDVTENHLKEISAQKIAIKIREKIRQELHLTASAGVGPNKFIAKLASDFRKPDGLVVVPPGKVFQFIENLPVERFWGVGPVTTRKLHALGMRTAADIRAESLVRLEKELGAFGKFLYELAHGRDSREVDARSDPKSRGTETTFERDIWDHQELRNHLCVQAKELSQELQSLGRPGRTITLKIKYADFTLITRSRTLPDPTFDFRLILKITEELLVQNTEISSRPVRLLGISVGSLVRDSDPLQLWFEFDL